jgi:homocysteine S-methyltransferase
VTDSIQAILEHQAFVLLDGALATELESRGADLNDPLWSARVLVDAPELIREVHATYFESGADCATTASYQASFDGFARRGFSFDEAAALMRRSVTLALEARDAFWANLERRTRRVKPFVAASVGPYGAFLADGSEYSGDYGLSQAELEAFHAPRLAVLADSGADVLAFETIPSALEARALLRVLERHPHARAWLSFSARDGAHICHGEAFKDCVLEFGAHPQVVAIGVNCTAPQFIPELLGSARGLTSTPLLAYPNSGEAYDPISKTWGGACSSEDFVAQAQSWLEAGARVIGGCCRTTPAHIAAVRRTLLEVNAT